MSIPPGRTRAPDASRYLRPRGEPPIWVTTPSVTARSHCAEVPAVTTVPPRTTRSAISSRSPGSALMFLLDTVAAEEFGYLGARRLRVIWVQRHAVERGARFDQHADGRGPVRAGIV